MASDTQEHNGASTSEKDHVTPPPPDNTSSPDLPSSPTSEDKEVQNPKDTNEDSTASDNDAGERPIRQKLKETTIAGTTDAPASTATSDSSSSSRGRAARKRSFDDLQAESNDAAPESKDNTGHRRKRSRDSKEPSTPPSEPSKEVDDKSKILSPKKKRSIDQLEKDDVEMEKPAGETTAEKGFSGETLRVEGEPEKKRHRDNSQERDSAAEPTDEVSKPSLPSAFANTSAVSPFASLAPKSKKEEEAPKTTHVTSASAFASSTFGAFASSTQSPFSSLGASTPSVFKSTSTTEPEKPALTGFASAAGPSPFAAAATTGNSGFGTLGSGFAGFAATSKPAGGLTSFAAPGGPGILGTTKAKPFGASGDNSDEEGEEDEAKTGSQIPAFEKEKEDGRFFEQPIETGEEEETTYFSCKAKLFGFSGREWKERGIGTFKVNVKEPEDDGGKKTARMIMRADGVLRVMLNTPIFKGMTVGDATGKEPTTKQLHLASLEDGRSVPLLLRTGSNELAKELYHVVRQLQEEL